jgi:hypothetical protein
VSRARSTSCYQATFCGDFAAEIAFFSFSLSNAWRGEGKSENCTEARRCCWRGKLELEVALEANGDFRCSRVGSGWVEADKGRRERSLTLCDDEFSVSDAPRPRADSDFAARRGECKSSRSDSESHGICILATLQRPERPDSTQLCARIRLINCSERISLRLQSVDP